MLCPRVGLVTAVKTRGDAIWQARRMNVTPEPRLRAAVVLVAAGAGSRVGAPTNKVLLPLHGVPVLAWSLRTVCSLEYVDQVVLVVRETDVEAVTELAERHLPEGREAVMVTGGATRHASEWRGLQALRSRIEAGSLDVVAIHDGARPLADAALFDATCRAALEHGGALPARPQPGLVTADGRRHVTGLVGVQTPQAFRAGPLLAAYERAEADGFSGTDTAGCVAAYTDLEVRAVPAPATNLKVTFAEDLALAERLLAGRP
jgi:2-C-methyl-D-erythritol 4-phosphate cytidylyltransferase